MSLVTSFEIDAPVPLPLVVSRNVFNWIGKSLLHVKREVAVRIEEFLKSLSTSSALVLTNGQSKARIDRFNSRNTLPAPSSSEWSIESGTRLQKRIVFEEQSEDEEEETPPYRSQSSSKISRKSFDILTTFSCPPLRLLSVICSHPLIGQ